LNIYIAPIQEKLLRGTTELVLTRPRATYRYR